MKLTSMKMSKKEKKKYDGEIPSESRPEYPYGLSINLENESMEKLNLNAKNLKAGSTVMVHAKAMIERVSSEKVAKGKDSESIRLQFTDIAIDGVKKSKFQQYDEESKNGPGD